MIMINPLSNFFHPQQLFSSAATNLREKMKVYYNVHIIENDDNDRQQPKFNSAKVRLLLIVS